MERRAFEAAESSLLFLFEDVQIHRNTQAQLINGGYRSVDMFARYGADEKEIRENLVEDLDLKRTDGLEAKAEISRVLVAWGKAKSRADELSKAKAEAKALKTLHVIEAGDLAIMRRAYEGKAAELDDAEVPSQSLVSKQLEKLETNFLEAEPLTEVSCLQDKEEELLQSKLGTDGQIKVQKATAKIPAPQNGEELRNRHKRLALSWLFAAEKHGARPWLKDVSLETYGHLSTYILGERVAAMRAALPGGDLTAAPPWTLVLSYEFQIRKYAYKLVMDEGKTLDEALRKSCRDPELRQRYFMDMITLLSRNQPAQRAAPPPQAQVELRPNKRKAHKFQKKQSQQWARQAGGGGGNDGSWGTGKVKSDCGNFFIRHPSSKTEICFQYNRGRCMENCPGKRAHICIGCLEKHSWPECNKFDPQMTIPSTKGGGKGKQKK